MRKLEDLCHYKGRLADLESRDRQHVAQMADLHSRDRQQVARIRVLEDRVATLERALGYEVGGHPPREPLVRAYSPS